MAAATLEKGPELRRTLSLRMKDVYERTGTGQSLDKDYGENVGGPPKNRRAGVILHPTSLPGPYGTGEIGKEAFIFIDWLASAGMKAWQVLPLVPPETGFWSPYSGLDALCGNVLLIALDELVEEGLLDESDIPSPVPVAFARFDQVAKAKTPLLVKAADRLLGDSQFEKLRVQMEAFRGENAWVEDSALFYALAHFNEGTKDTAWWTWPGPLRFREPAAIEEHKAKFATEINRFVAEQFLFDRQWKAVKAYANERGIVIVGDMPIYVGAQSADVWAYPDLFELDAETGAPTVVSGVPPDAFSDDGQLWGSPLYDWEAQKKAGYIWWVQRLSRAFQLYDETRIDHFRGFAGYWAVESTEKTAVNGVWRKGPGKDLFDVLDQKLGGVPIIAEDLGVITPDVHELREGIGAPGMVVLQFAFGSGATNTHLPHNHYENCVCYPGTHDNETAVGWWADSAGEEERAYLGQYLGLSEVDDPAWALIREAYKSISRTSIIMMQDIMRLDNSARMNFPGTTKDNWGWRIGEPGVLEGLAEEAAALRELAEAYDRLTHGVKTSKP